MDSVWSLEGPKLSSKGRTADQRPWVERFWISRFGAKNKGYRVIHTGNLVRTKLGNVYDKVSSPINTMVKADLKKMISWATESSSG